MDQNRRANMDAPSSLPKSSRPSNATQFTVNRDSRRPLFGTSAGRENSNIPRASTPSGVRREKTSPAAPAATASPKMAFAKHAALAGAAIIRPSSAGSVGSRSENNNLSSATKNTRIPRPATAAPNSTNSRRPITLMEAYRLAEEEEELRGAPYGPDASPSPAPRPWRSRNSSEEAKMRKLLNQDPQDIRGRESKTPDVGRSSIPRRPGSSLSERSSHSSGSSDRRVSSDANKGNLSAKSGLFSKSKVGPNIARTGEALARKASNSSLRSSGSVSPAPRAYRERNSLGREDNVPNFDPLPEIRAVYSYPTPEYEGNASSPNKSYAWQLENDFTAGDLSISESPRIRVDSTGETTAKPQLEEAAKLDPPRHSPWRPANTKLNEIMEREVQDEKQHPHLGSPQPRPFTTRMGEIQALEREIDNLLPNRWDRPKNTKLDEIRAREKEIMSNKSVAASRLEEIRELNSQPRVKPQLTPPPVVPEVGQESTAFYDAASASRPSYGLGQGEQIPHTPVTIYRKGRQDNISNTKAPSVEDLSNKASTNSNRDSDVPRDRQINDLATQDSSRELLQRLAHAASTSPAVETTTPPPPPPKEETLPRRRENANISQPSSRPARAVVSQQENKQPSPNKHNSNNNNTKTHLSTEQRRTQRMSDNKDLEKKPSVGFVGVRRASSSEATQEKRRSLHSDGDPTERIEREMLLFAPADNHSERGSIYIPSPALSSDEDEPKDDGAVDETPRPKKQQDILAMPTPRIIGAYVETPATIKVGRVEDDKPTRPPAETKLQRAEPIVRRRGDSQSGGGSDSELRKPKNRASSRPRRRAKSLSKNRLPLINSANPPTVKDDLYELQRAHNIEDSTLDDFGDLLSNDRLADSPELDQILEDLKDKLLEEVTKDQEKKRPGRSSKERTPDGGSDLEALNRMTKSVTSSLRDLHAVKRGIDRLSDQVNLPDLNPADQGAEPPAKPVAPAGSDAINEKTLAKATELLKAELLKSGSFPPVVSNPDQAIVVHYPRLYTNRPFRLTLLGLVTGLFTLWCVAESAMCAQYCRPAICSEPPCVWSPDDPTWGVAIPKKLDQWVIGGRGRLFASRLADEWDDLVADASDLLHGVDIRNTNPDELDFRDRRQYRRRMRKKGLLKQRAESPAHKEKWDAWHAARIATERASAAREMGYDVYDESESMGDDAKA